MTVVLDENKWAEEMINECSLGKKPSETIRRVARYYIDAGYSTANVRKMLDHFLLQCNPAASLPKWSDAIDMAYAQKCSAIKIDCVRITDKEMEVVDNIEGRQRQRLAFALLCLSKYWDEVTHTQSHWVNNKDSEIMNMANVNTSIKRQSLFYHDLNEAGLIQFSRKVGNTHVKVLFAGQGDNVVLEISDFRNLGYQYLMYKGEPFIRCQNCGIVTKLNHPKMGVSQKYCRECASKVMIQQKVNYTMRMRMSNRV